MEKFKKITISRRSQHNIFFLKKGEVSYLGFRKKINEHSHYSILEDKMLMGKIIKYEEKESDIIFILLVPKEYNWYSEVFEKEQKVNIHFPYPPIDENGNEKICPDSYWDDVSKTAFILDDDEKIFREHSVEILKNIVFDGCRIYDPACSTGCFLSYIRRDYQSAHYFASDRSASMVKIAQNCLPNVFKEDVENLNLKEYYDIIFCRFLNQEVIASKHAASALSNLFDILNKKGYIIIFGHTPIVCDIPKFAETNGINILSCVGKSLKPKGLFQYYLLQKN